MLFDDDALDQDPDIQFKPLSAKPVGWIRIAVSNAKYRSRRRGLTFDITAEDMVEKWREQEGLCYWFNVPMGTMENQRRHPLTPSIDRVDSYGGYTYDNVVWACLAANTAKMATDPECWEEFLSLLAVSIEK
jgi:hypothetical protein